MMLFGSAGRAFGSCPGPRRVFLLRRHHQSEHGVVPRRFRGTQTRECDRVTIGAEGGIAAALQCGLVVGDKSGRWRAAPRPYLHAVVVAVLDLHPDSQRPLGVLSGKGDVVVLDE